ncbi:caspase domain-containing protein [Armillaria nabsnona]|nr:caspase domain-containing protein [Armillaria nabsnona]
MLSALRFAPPLDTFMEEQAEAFVSLEMTVGVLNALRHSPVKYTGYPEDTFMGKAKQPHVSLNSGLPAAYPSATKRHALLIGINHYDDNPLDGCINDVQAIQDLLISHYHYPASDVVTMTDDSPLLLPTRSNILRHMHDMVGNAQEGDSLIIYYAGHGTRYSESIYTTVSSMEEDIVEAMCPLDRGKIVNGEMVLDITDRDLSEILSEARANVTLVLDCCHGGSFIDVQNCRSGKVRYANPLLDMGKTLFQGSPTARIHHNRALAPYILLQACQSFQVAFEGCHGHHSKTHGDFTRALVDALKDDAERTMSYKDLLRHIGSLPLQTPTVCGDGYATPLWAASEQNA